LKDLLFHIISDTPTLSPPPRFTSALAHSYFHLYSARRDLEARGQDPDTNFSLLLTSALKPRPPPLRFLLQPSRRLPWPDLRCERDQRQSEKSFNQQLGRVLVVCIVCCCCATCIRMLIPPCHLRNRVLSRPRPSCSTRRLKTVYLLSRLSLCSRSTIVRRVPFTGFTRADTPHSKVLSPIGSR